MRTVGVAGPHPGRSDSPSLRPGAHEDRDVDCASPGYSQVFPILASFELQRVLPIEPFLKNFLLVAVSSSELRAS